MLASRINQRVGGRKCRDRLPFATIAHSHSFFGVDQLSLFHSFSEVFGHKVGAILPPSELLHVAVDGQRRLARQPL